MSLKKRFTEVQAFIPWILSLDWFYYFSQQNGLSGMAWILTGLAHCNYEHLHHKALPVVMLFPIIHPSDTADLLRTIHGVQLMIRKLNFPNPSCTLIDNHIWDIMQRVRQRGTVNGLVDELFSVCTSLVNTSLPCPLTSGLFAFADSHQFEINDFIICCPFVGWSVQGLKCVWKKRVIWDTSSRAVILVLYLFDFSYY